MAKNLDSWSFLQKTPYMYGRQLFGEALGQLIKEVIGGKALLPQWKVSKPPLEAPSSSKHRAIVCAKQASTLNPKFSLSFQNKAWPMKTTKPSPKPTSQWRGSFQMWGMSVSLPLSGSQRYQTCCLKGVQNTVQTSSTAPIPSLKSAKDCPRTVRFTESLEPPYVPGSNCASTVTRKVPWTLLKPVYITKAEHPILNLKYLNTFLQILKCYIEFVGTVIASLG